MMQNNHAISKFIETKHRSSVFSEYI